jgi:DNA-nicking Smr family endonuclease
MDRDEPHDAVELPIDGVLDLHAFPPAVVEDLLSDYLSACVERNLTDVRIIHGKGKGILQKRVHAFLRRSSLVHSFGLAGDGAGGWGATLVRLRVDREPG